MFIQTVFRGRVRSGFVLSVLLAPAAACSGSNQASNGTVGNGSASDAGGSAGDGSVQVVLPVEVLEASSESCTAPNLVCDGGCLTNDALNCGSCGNVCPAAEGGTPTCTATGGTYACGIACETGFTSCGGACVPTTTFQSDPNNCGSCGYGCMAGECVGGSCQPWALATGLGLPIQVATDGVHVAYCAGAGGFEVPLTGGTTVQLTPDISTCSTIAMGGGQVAFGDQSSGSVNSILVAIDDQASSAVSVNVASTGPILSIALSHDGTTAYPDVGGVIDSCALGSAASCASLFTPPGAPGTVNTLATTSAYLFTTDVARGQLLRYLLPSGPSTAVASDSGLSQYIALDATYVYWASFSGSTWSINRVSQINPTTTQLVATIPFPHVGGIATDGSNVYAIGSSSSDGSLASYIAYAPIPTSSADAGADAGNAASGPTAAVTIYEGDEVDGLAAGGGAIVWADITTSKIYALRAP